MEEKLRLAVTAGIITAAQAEQLKLLWQDGQEDLRSPVDDKSAGFSNFLYYPDST